MAGLSDQIRPGWEVCCRRLARGEAGGSRDRQDNRPAHDAGGEAKGRAGVSWWKGNYMMFY